MILSLDTNVLIELANARRPQVRERYLEAVTGGRQMAVSAIVLQELRFGALISDRPAVELAALDALLADKPIVDFTIADADEVARVRAELERKGRRIGAYDVLIAGQARARDWAVVTANTREFARIDDLEVIDWTKG